MNRPILLTYYFVRDKLAGTNPSIRKRFCLAYLRWAAECRPAFKEDVVELAKEWRKVEKRVGDKRTKIEKVARKFFRQITRKKNNAASREAASEFASEQVKNKTGVHAPEFAERRLELLKACSRNKGKGFWWVITAPDGTEFVVRSMANWAKENGIDKRNLHKTAVKPNYTAKGYRCRKFNPDVDTLPEGG